MDQAVAESGQGIGHRRGADGGAGVGGRIGRGRGHLRRSGGTGGLAAIIPLVQIPVLDDGRVMTASAATTLYLAGMTGSDLLVPVGGAARG